MTQHRPTELAAYAAAGYELIPLHRFDYVDKQRRKRGKSPRDVDWRRRDYSSFDAAAHMAETSNVGVRLRPCDLVIDVDPRNFRPGDDPIARLAADAGLDLDRVPRVATGAGGSHYYMRKPADLLVRDTLEEYPGVEFKTFGRQVVAAGSLHPDTGRAYEWDWLSPPLDRETHAPQALLALIERASARPGESGLGGHTPEELKVMLDALRAEDFREHSRWLELMMACHHATAGEGRTEFVEWSASDPIYADHGGVVGRRWDSLRARQGGVTTATLYLRLKEAGALHLLDRRASYDFPDDIAEIRQ